MDTLFHFDISAVIQSFGYVGIFAIVFAESGLFFGFFFILAPLIVFGAILGDTVGYWFGAKVGPKIFTRNDSFFFNKQHIARTHLFYLKYGSKAIIIARFVPVVRTFVPILAGVGTMPYGIFLRYNIVGGLVWGTGVTLLGYFLGTAVPNIEQYLLPIILGIIVVSFLPIGVEFWKSKREHKK
jgi:membrane-associated protein